MKRFVAMFLIVGILLSSSAPFVYADYEVRDGGYVQSDEKYAPREEVVAAFVRAVGLDFSAANPEILKRFRDSGKIASAYLREIAAAVENEMVSGYEDGTFRPREKITRAEALMILDRTLKKRTLPAKTSVSFTDTPGWAKEAVNRLAAAGVVKGYGNGVLGADDDLTWQQVNLLTERAARMVGPTGNYYEYANEKWLNETEIPEGYTVWSDIYSIDREIMQEIGDIVYSLYQRQVRDGEKFQAGSSEQKMVDVFIAAGNTVYRDKLGLEPVSEYLKKIDGVKDLNGLLKVMAQLEYNGFHGLLPVAVGEDVYDSSKFTLTYSECYTGINAELIKQDRDGRMTAAYETYLTELFTLFGEERAAERAKQVTALCMQLAQVSLDLEDHNQIERNYMIFDMETLHEIFSNLDITVFLNELGFSGVDTMVVYDLPLTREVNKVFVSENLELLKDYLRASVMDGSAMYLNTDAFLIWRSYQDAINQTESQVMPADYAVEMVEELLGWDLAKLYAERYASAETKAAVERMTQEILEAYQKRIRQNSWMSREGKQAALKKLERLQIRVGYPENVKDYTDPGFQIRSIWDGGSLMEYRTDYCKRYFDTGAAALRTEGAKVDRTRWEMLPQTVNAMYEPSGNSITIPAGILRPPFYDARASKERNLGGIGSVIAHEISHAFDAVGAKFDENGNLKNWWQKQDKEAFDRICAQVTKAYDEIEVMPGEYINGKLTLSENLADLAGMTCILDVAGEGNPRLEDLFLGYASVWRIKAEDSYREMMLKIDTHSPDEIRVNRVLSNFDVFTNFYEIQDGDGMYLPKEKKIQIWNRGL